MEKIILSIIIPVYNTNELFLEECFKSIQKSNIKVTHEIIVVDDGSTNKPTLNFLDNLKDDKITVLRQENKGAAAARNLAVKNTKGELLLPFDSDDILYPNIVNEFIDTLLKDSKYDVVYGNMQMFGDRDISWDTGEYNRFKLLYLGSYIPTIAVYRRNMWVKLNGYDEEYKIAEDWDFWVRGSLNNFKFKHLPITFFGYRYSDEHKSLYIRERGKKKFSTKKTKDTYDNEAEVDYTIVNNYVIYSMKKEKSLIIKAMLIVFFPKLFNFMLRKKWINNNKIIS